MGTDTIDLLRAIRKALVHPTAQNEEAVADNRPVVDGDGSGHGNGYGTLIGDGAGDGTETPDYLYGDENGDGQGCGYGYGTLDGDGCGDGTGFNYGNQAPVKLGD